MPEENQQRLIELRKNNPFSTIYLIYDSRLLTKNSIDLMRYFCFDIKVILIDAIKIIGECKDEQQRAFVEKYNDEVLHLDELGNLGAASDFLRILTPSLRLGIYSDFDVSVTFNNFHRPVDVNAPFLFNLDGLPQNAINMSYSVNNDVLAVADFDAAKDILDNIRQTMLDTCNGQAVNYFFKIIDSNGLKPDQLRMLMEEDEHLESVVLLSLVPQSTSLRQWRSDIIELFNEKNGFYRVWFACYGEQVGDNLASEFLRLQREVNQKRLTKNPESEAYQYLAQMDDLEFITTVLCHLKQIMLIQSVSITSGPGAIHAALIKRQMSSLEYQQQYQSYSYRFYSVLNRSIIAPEEGDLSWLDDVDDLKPLNGDAPLPGLTF